MQNACMYARGLFAGAAAPLPHLAQSGVQFYRDSYLEYDRGIERFCLCECCGNGGFTTRFYSF